jgi:hypothetical protein
MSDGEGEVPHTDSFHRLDERRDAFVRLPSHRGKMRMNECQHTSVYIECFPPFC